MWLWISMIISFVFYIMGYIINPNHKQITSRSNHIRKRMYQGTTASLTLCFVLILKNVSNQLLVELFIIPISSVIFSSLFLWFSWLKRRER